MDKLEARCSIVGSTKTKPHATRMEHKNQATIQLIILALIFHINHITISVHTLNNFQQTNETLNAIDKQGKVSSPKSELMDPPVEQATTPQSDNSLANSIEMDTKVNMAQLDPKPAVTEIDTQANDERQNVSQQPAKISLEEEHDESSTTNDQLDFSYHNSIASRVNPSTGKSRRQAENLKDAGDWWTRVTFKQANPKQSDQQEIVESPEQTTRRPAKPSHWSGSGKSPAATDQRRAAKPPTSTKRPVYKEQPKNQNPIVTLRYQLSAIRDQHKTLVMRSMRQLQQLDQRLIESYRLCFKRKLPLYGGMLYRSRDFVARMARDVRMERAKLETMTRKIQADLKQKMANRTIVREYNKLTQSTGLKGSSNEMNIQKVDEELQQKERKSDLESQNGILDDIDEQARVYKPKRQRKNSYVVNMSEVYMRKELDKSQALIDRINGSSHDINTVIDDINYLFKLTIPDQARQSKYPANKNYKFNRKSPITPIGTLFERYGKLTQGPMASLISQNNESSTNMAEPQDLKPLIEQASLVYTDPIDPDLGFDKPVGREVNQL